MSGRPDPEEPGNVFSKSSRMQHSPPGHVPTQEKPKSPVQMLEDEVSRANLRAENARQQLAIARRAEQEAAERSYAGGSAASDVDVPLNPNPVFYMGQGLPNPGADGGSAETFKAPAAISRASSMTSIASSAGGKRQRDEEGNPVAFKRTKPDTRKVMSVLEEVNNILEAPKISKTMKETVKAHIFTLAEMVTNMQLEVAYLRGRVEERSKLEVKVEKLLESASPPSAGKSFAAVAGRGVVASSAGVAVSSQIPKASTPVVFIRPAEGKRENKSIREDVLAALDPARDGLKVRHMRSAGDSRIAVEAGDWTTVERLKKSDALKSRGLQVTEESKVRPRVIVYDVPSDLEHAAFVNTVFEQNFHEHYTSEQFSKNFKVIFRKGRRDTPKVNLVCEVTSTLRRILIERSHLFVDWFSCRVDDFVGLSRCFKCQEFGHVAKFCRGVEICRHCGKSGHQVSACPTPEVAVVCKPCLSRKQPHGHAVGSKDCITYARGVESYLKRVNYG